MELLTRRRLVLLVGLLFTPVVGFVSIAGAQVYDGGALGHALVLCLPLAVYATGFHLVLAGFHADRRPV